MELKNTILKSGLVGIFAVIMLLMSNEIVKWREKRELKASEILPIAFILFMWGNMGIEHTNIEGLINELGRDVEW